MIRRFAATLLLLLLAVACTRQSSEVVDAGAAEAPVERTEVTSLAGLYNGAVVVDRTGELNLDNSALHAFDSNIRTSWLSPPGDVSQTVLVSLPALSRIGRLGFAAPSFVSGGGFLTGTVEFEGSTDGASFGTRHLLKFDSLSTDMTREVDPFEARFLRITVVAPLEEGNIAALPEVVVEGEELAPVTPPVLQGTWMINNSRAVFRTEGTRLSGVIDLKPQMWIEGVAGERTIRFVWSRGMESGIGVLTVTPDGLRLNGLWWHEARVLGRYFGISWYGRRIGEGGEDLPSNPMRAVLTLLDRRGHVPLFGFHFDTKDELQPERGEEAVEVLQEVMARLDVRFRLVVHDAYGRSAEESKAASERRAASLRSFLEARNIDLGRLEVVGTGIEQITGERTTQLQKLLASRVDLEIVRPQEK